MTDAARLRRRVRLPVAQRRLAEPMMELVASNSAHGEHLLLVARNRAGFLIDASSEPGKDGHQAGFPR